MFEQIDFEVIKFLILSYWNVFLPFIPVGNTFPFYFIYRGMYFPFWNFMSMRNGGGKRREVYFKYDFLSIDLKYLYKIFIE